MPVATPGKGPPPVQGWLQVKLQGRLLPGAYLLGLCQPLLLRWGAYAVQAGRPAAR